MEDMNLFEDSLEHKLSFEDVIELTNEYAKLYFETEGTCLTYSDYLKSKGINGTIIFDLDIAENRKLFEKLAFIYMESNVQVSLKTHQNSRVPAEVVYRTTTKGLFKKRKSIKCVEFEIYNRYVTLDNVTKVYIQV